MWVVDGLMLYKIVGNTTSSRDDRSILSKVGN